MDCRNVKWEQAEAIERMFGIKRPQAFLLKSIPVLTVTDHAQVGFTQPRPVFTNQVQPGTAPKAVHHTPRLVPAKPNDDGVVIYWTDGTRTRLPP